MTTMNPDDRETPERIWVELRTQHAFNVKPEPYVETVEYLRTADFNAHYEDLMRAALLREESTATRMRDLCVEAAKQTVFAEAVRLGISAERAITLSSKTMNALESLTLDQVKEK